MVNSDKEKYRAEAKRKIAAAKKRQVSEKQAKTPAKRKLTSQAKVTAAASAAAKKSKGERGEQKSGIETWDGLDTKQRRSTGEERARRQNASAKSRPQAKTNSRPGSVSARTAAKPKTAYEKAEINEQMRSLQKRRDRSRVIMLSVVVVLVLTVTTTLIYLLLNQKDKNANLQFVYENSLLESYEATALVVRDEIVVNAEAGGTVSPLVAEGYYTRVGQDMAMIIGDEMNETLVELESYRRQISDVQLEMIASGQVVGAAAVYQETDKQLKPLINELRRTAVNRRMDTLPATMTSIDLVLQERNSHLSDVLFDNAILDTLKSEQSILEQRLAVNAQILKAEKAGLVSFASDGMEEELGIRHMGNITPDDVAAFIKDSQNMGLLPRTIINGQQVLRQVTGVDQYLAMTVKDLSYSYFTDRKTVELYLPGEDVRISDVEVVRAEPKVGAVFLVLKTDKEVGRLLDQRTARVEVITNEVRGLKGPRTALRAGEELSTVVKLVTVQNGYYRTVDVNVLAADDDFAIVEAINKDVVLRQGSLIVLNPDAVTEGSPVK